MPGRPVSHEQAKPGGLFDQIGKFVIRRPALIIGLWLVTTAILFGTLPSLHLQAVKHQEAPLPNDAPSVALSKQMGRAFHEIEGGSLLLVVLTDERGLSPSDENVYRGLIKNLRQDTQDKVLVQDFLTVPALRQILESTDKKAWNLPISFPGEGPTAETQQAYRHIAEIVRSSVAGTTLSASLSGPVATISDFQQLGEDDSRVIEIGTVLCVLAILFTIYRNLVTMLLPVVTIGASVLFAQGTLSALSDHGLALNMQVVAFISAVMIGAGTDYAVFLISRYHDYVRQGVDSDQAVERALLSIGKVIVASAATVAITFLAMVFTRLKVFSAVGPATAIAIAVSLLAAVTLLPALLVLAGRRGWIHPRRELASRFWRRSGTAIARRPVTYLAGSLVVLVVLAGSASLIHLSFDDVRFLPRDVGSVVGYEQINHHFPMNTMTPAVLLVQSPRDLRTPAALADLEEMARRISELPDVAVVRGLTRPTGETVEQMKASFQTGEVGSRLSDVSTTIGNRAGDLDTLAGSSHQLAGALAHVREQLIGAASGADRLITAVEDLKAFLTTNQTRQQLVNAGQIVGRMAALSSNLSTTVASAQQIARWADPMVPALTSSPVCSADPGCVRSRTELASLVQADKDGTLASVAALAASFRENPDPNTVSQTMKQFEQQLGMAHTLLRTMDGLRGRVAQMTLGADTLAQGSAAVAEGVQQLVDRTKQLGTGLNEASSFLLSIKRDAHTRSMNGFYVPPQFMSRGENFSGAGIFISDDGHSVRYFIQSALNPFTTSAMDQISRITSAARSAQRNTELVDASIGLTGITAGLKDIHDYYRSDMEFIVISTVVIVFLVLAALLRAIVAPLYLITSVLISYLSALGLSVIVFQLLLDQQMHWSLPGLSFVCLVAVGADYNMLLISRIREESSDGVRLGVVRTVGATGGVITSAGMIFAASMFGLMAASIGTVVQAGFTIGMGILLDTFLVRTATVPALVAIIGRASWWPGERAGKWLRNTSNALAYQLSRGSRGLSGGVSGPADKRCTPGTVTSSVEPPKPGAAAVISGLLQSRSGIHALPLFACHHGTQPPPRRSQSRRSRPTNKAQEVSRPDADFVQHALPLFCLIEAPITAN